MLIMKPSARLYNAMEEEMCERFETTFTPLESRFLHNVSSSRKSNEHGKRKWHKNFFFSHSSSMEKVLHKHAQNACYNLSTKKSITYINFEWWKTKSCPLLPRLVARSPPFPKLIVTELVNIFFSFYTLVAFCHGCPLPKLIVTQPINTPFFLISPIRVHQRAWKKLIPLKLHHFWREENTRYDLYILLY